MFDSLRNDEFNDLLKLGWLEEGTVGDAGKYRLSAKGLAAYTRLLESVPAKDQVLVQLKVLANAYQTPAALKALMN
jgi:hypothetical protein